MLDEPEEIKGIDLVKEKLSVLQLFCLIKKNPKQPKNKPLCSGQKRSIKKVLIKSIQYA